MGAVVLLIGCGSVAPRLQRAGFETVEAAYFWGSEAIHSECVAAVVDFSVGGDSGLAVADRLLRKGLVAVILFRPEDRDCVLPRFLGVELSRTRGPGPDLESALECCRRRTAALRAEGMRAIGEEADFASVGESMILAVELLARADEPSVLDEQGISGGGGGWMSSSWHGPCSGPEYEQTDPRTDETMLAHHRCQR